ncbi:DNA-binding response OmpR family regulator [Aminobacter niigataensis]|uniref:DNA-binding response OmpR family regulator n=2 Tax=Aminobacter niigataensis TaxID=83265 RepID=A0ABR6KZP1_9HYPH|nr:helix-turn-helix domain-containing protein [Aminobacter niigataensis]MBB4649260.1 DNA-binding response OmpR family regulator [Aminobacter niigataensis]
MTKHSSQDEISETSQTVAAGQLLADVYWLENEDPEIKIIDVWICKLRKKLLPLGVKIETVWGRGYRLLPVASQKEAA